jgi:hypothetical protein
MTAPQTLLTVVHGGADHRPSVVPVYDPNIPQQRMCHSCGNAQPVVKPPAWWGEGL